VKKLFALLFIAILAALTLCACTAASKLSFSSAVYEVGTGTSFTPRMNISPKGANFTLSSSNRSLAVVEDNIVMAFREGTFTLTAVSGKRRASCTVNVYDGAVTQSPDIVLKDTYYIYLEIANYEKAGLETGVLQGMVVAQGSKISVGTPYVEGFFVDCWYLDKEGKNKFDENTPITASGVLYAFLAELDNDFIVRDGLVTGILYKNLPHSIIDLPDKTANGEDVIGIGDGAFSNDLDVVSVKIPASYRAIGTAAFENCKNLETVIIAPSSVLEAVGLNAFGECSLLSYINLPDTVSVVQAFAFYKCESLVLENIPSALTSIYKYSFSGTKLKTAAMPNVKDIDEGAFKDCKDLTQVTQTQRVIACERTAFEGSKMHLDAQSGFNSSDPSSALFYAGTILYGCDGRFGKGYGSGRVRLREDTTLVANNAFNLIGLTELTLDFSTDNMTASLDTTDFFFIGRDVFTSAVGVCVIVKEADYAKAVLRYSVTGYDYRERLYSIKTVTVDGFSGTENAGIHTLLRYIDTAGAERFRYEKFTPFDALRSPTNIKLSNLPSVGAQITRLNMYAFYGLQNLKVLEFSKVALIAYFAVSSCPNLEEIQLYHTTTIARAVRLEHENSIQFTSCPNAKVYVADEGALQSYRTAWADFTTAVSKLEVKK